MSIYLAANKAVRVILDEKQSCRVEGEYTNDSQIRKKTNSMHKYRSTYFYFCNPVRNESHSGGYSREFEDVVKGFNLP